MSDEPPATDEGAAGESAAAGAPSGGTWGSTLSCQELAAIATVGFTPVGQVLGVAVYAAGSENRTGCPGDFGLLVEAMYQARDTAVGRMAAQCAALGGHGVVAVQVSRGPFEVGGQQFAAIGTAVRAAGAGTSPQAPFTSGLSGQDFARLVRAGWVPAGLVLGIAIGSWHDDRATVRQRRPWSANSEMAGWTALVNQARRDARSRLEDDVRRVGAEGVVIAGMRLHARARDCPVTTGRRDHVAEVALTGTAIASFSRADRGHTGRALAVMPLKRWPRQYPDGTGSSTSG